MQEVENTGGDPLDVEIKKGTDCRERQKLLREQNIVKQVMELHACDIFLFQRDLPIFEKIWLFEI